MTTLPEIPDRYRVGSPAFRHAHMLRICLDGEAQRMVMAYSISGGWVERIKTDADGKPVLTEDGSDVVTERVTGLVLVEYDPDKVRAYS